MPGKDCSNCATGLGTVTFGHYFVYKADAKPPFKDIYHLTYWAR
ncbi:uncharacterized protein PgNI_12170 [Pyricularia grisea]|uniref:Uncharacterized protein n=1 Tax=Pyricularia grisea TaxID=148305 RepID=A0A6P8AQ97_PYRGI|nr:uncharacterized protein PgNI_12170 [Pyricularia grisea]TLD04240.1 hypothetical protein PgNI_12170 [Pyricularia grisea]